MRRQLCTKKKEPRWHHKTPAHWLNPVTSICSSSQMRTACPAHLDESTAATEGPYERAPQSGETPPASIYSLSSWMMSPAGPRPRGASGEGGGWREVHSLPSVRFMERPSSRFTLGDESPVTLLGGRVKGVWVGGVSQRQRRARKRRPLLVATF